MFDGGKEKGLSEGKSLTSTAKGLPSQVPKLKIFIENGFGCNKNILT